jgi:hypothetical protein
MKKIIVAFLSCLYGTIANAQTDFVTIPKQVTCGPLQHIISALMSSDINEKPVLVGKDDNEKSDYAIFLNAETKTFTIVQIIKATGCILGSGKIIPTM